MKRYAIVLERAVDNWAAYVPDLPGCVATGDTEKQTLRRIRTAIDMHIQGMIEDDQTIPEPTSRVEYLDVAA